MIHHNKTIGVLGGMGPAASSNFYHKAIRYAQEHYGAVMDADYPPMIIYSLPIEGFDETGITDERLVRQQLIAGVQRLESAGCDLIVIPCNTVHVYYNEMQAATTVPIFNIVEETKQQVLASGYTRLGMFASASTRRLGLYQKIFTQAGLALIEPTDEQQAVLDRVIEHVMGGNQKSDDVIALKDIARDYLRNGAEAVVMGCTEIPLAINQTHTDIKLFDSIEILVRCAVDYSLNK